VIPQSPGVELFTRAEPNTTIPFVVRIRSEDSGDPIKLLMYLDYSTREEQFADLQEDLAPGTFDEVREPRLEWRVPPVVLVPLPECRTPNPPASCEPRRCHALTLVATHQSNLRPGAVTECARPTQSDRPCFVDRTAVGTATWWLDMRAPTDTEPLLLDECSPGL
jgi:hypothetical protein